ncbi:minor tail protein [Arthrobacter phage LiSara]|uniref:Minor tail protein n=1 Tax=Arthrobacter phage LiSara TaxID=2015860 RepID=A0A222ZHD9_9CAUD|nr:minor tail protein [Arthrobacter phage LiSara]ASR83611.1 minor tail protein [Arthrobacter phage LiSara]
MTLIQVRVHRPSDTGTIPAGGQLEWTPTAATSIPTSPVTVVLPASFTVNLTDDINEFTAIETGPTWAWRVVETFPGQAQKTRYVLVTGEGPVDYTTLPSVDPATLEPAAQPDVPVWYAYVDALEAEAARSADAADVAKAAALAAQASATGSATAASQSATTAAARAVEAGTSAFNAGSSAATAAGHVTTAQQSAANAAASVVTAAGHATNAGTAASAASTAAGVAAGHVTAAAGSATAAAGSAAASQTARLGAEAARDRAELVATAFKIGDVTTSEPGAPASATIHGEGPFRELDLTIPRGVQGPPLVASVLGTETGPETPGATGMTGQKGDKGDPGGLVASSGLALLDLNTVLTAGMYTQSTAANGTLALNYPVDIVAGQLIVMRDTVGNFTTQVFYPYNGAYAGKIFWWRRFNASWSAWAAVGATRTDLTAGRAMYAWDNANNRDQLVFGDTGWREVTPSSGTASWIRLRRMGNIVHVWIGGWVNGTSADIITLPAGFQTGTNSMPGHWGDRAGVPVAININGPSSLVQAVTGASATPLFGYIQFATVNSWPTTLPGTAHATIPNL